MRRLTAALMFGLLSLYPQIGAAQARAAKPAATKKFAPKRLPWGDPDISGNFTTKDEANTPLERPDELAGKRLEDITPAELKEIGEARRRQAVEEAPFATGSRAEGIAIAVPIHWFDSLDSENSRPWFMVDPPDGKAPPPTAEALQRAAAAAAARQGRSVADSYTDRGLNDRCIVSFAGGPAPAEMLPKVYGNSYRILQTRDYVVIQYEMVHDTRIIPIEGRGAARPHRGSQLRSYWGDAIGRWEGDTFVVDTTNFKGGLQFRGIGTGGVAGVPGEGLHTIERFTRTASNKVEFTATVEDSHTWARPWTFAIPLTEDDTQGILEYACHEGNYGMRNILAGAREDQRKGIEPSNGPARAETGVITE